LTTANPTSCPPSFADLQRAVSAAGLLDYRYGYYLAKLATNSLMTAAGWISFALLGDSWWQLIVAAYLGFANVQIWLVVHDAGHAQIARNRKINNMLGYIHADLILGISAGWWVGYHNQHHGHPNHLSLDPGIRSRPMISDPRQTDGSTKLIRRFIIRHQAVLFFPLYLLDLVGLRVVTVRSLLGRAVRHMVAEASLILMHLVAFAAGTLLVLSPLRALLFIVVQHAFFGLYIGAIFGPNHRGMPVRHGEEPDWVHRQVTDARNVRPNRLIDFLFGGLNYQIEHHLFPTMPRPNLPRAQRLVREFCGLNQISYHQVPLVRAYREVVQHLAAVSRAWRMDQRTWRGTGS